MYRPVLSARLLDEARRRRAARVARRALERELASYTSEADRKDLQILVDDSGVAGREAAAILTRQADARLFRVS
jgi:hypothetical protein